ncbi:MAG: CAP domain-containing protein [Dehalococcoidia bacterium]
MMRKWNGWRLPLAGGIAGLAIGAAAMFGIGFDGGASALTNCSVSDNSIDAEEQAFLGLINNYRAQNGLQALTMSTNLNRSATWMAVDMGAKNYFSHTDSLGRSPSTRTQNCDYPSGAGENIAAGGAWSSASAVFNAWKNSSGHNANMLNGSYRQIGIARAYTSGSTYGWYWVTDFGLVNDGTSGSGGTNATATPTRTATQAAATATPTRTPTQAAATPTRTATATPTQPPASSGPASISSPSNGSNLSGSTATFQWSAVSGGLEYFFYAGTAPGSNNIVGRSVGLSTSYTATNLPASGGTIYVRLWTRFSNGWQYRDFTYTAANSGGGSQQASKAVMTSPSNGSQLAGTTVSFSWTPGSGAQQYFFYLGTSQGSNDLLGASAGLNTSVTLANMPRGGQPLHVRLWTLLPTGWQYNDYTYYAAP